MNIKNYLRKLGGLLIAVILLPGVVTLLSSTSAEAQRRGRVIIVRPIRPRFYNPWWGWGYGPYSPYGPYGYYSRFGHYVFDNADNAANQAYHDGLKTGEGDAKHRRSFDPQRSHYYQEAGFGNFGEVYRSNFVRGYNEGYRS